MKVIIDIPQDHKRVINNLVSDGKGYLLPQEVETRLAKAVKIGTVISDNATNGDMIKAIFPNLKIANDGLINDNLTGIMAYYGGDGSPLPRGNNCFNRKWWNAHYESEGK